MGKPFAIAIFLQIILCQSAWATAPLSYSLCDGSLNGAGFDCTSTPQDLDILAFDAATNKWKPKKPSFTSVNTGVTSNYTLTKSDGVVMIDVTAGAVTATLPLASEMSGKTFTIKKTDTSLNKITINTTDNELIDGVSSYLLYLPNQFITVISDETGWSIINSTGPLTKCPSGMSLMGSGRSAYCIENVARTAKNFIAASNACFADGLSLCTYAQWVLACSNGAPFVSSPPEWGSEAYKIDGVAILLGVGSCQNNNANYGYVNNSNSFRCCVK